MSKGKTSAQAAHASLGAFLKNPDQDWLKSGMKKIILKADNLERLQAEAEKSGLPNFLVVDAGLTELDLGTITALAIGPAEEENIDKITGDLPLL